MRLLIHRPADGSLNMAIDEALLIAAGSGSPPALRLFSWSRPTLSLGAHQPSTDADLAACRRLGVDLVRRPTGGAAVLHAAELTYSVTGRLGEEVFPSSVTGLYERISEALLAGLANLGVRGIASGADGVPRPRIADCFAVPSRREILVDGRKLVGSAQVRRGRAFLQHGSILIDWNASRLAQVLPSGGDDREPAPGSAAPPITLREILGRPIDREELASAVVRGFSETFHEHFVPGPLLPTEEENAARLRAFKYLDALWTLQGRMRRDSNASV